MMISMVALVLAAATAVPAFDAAFSQGSQDCSYQNYSNHSRHEFSELDGHSAVTFTYANCKDAKAYDTMWGVETRPFAVTGGYEGFFKIVLSGKVGMALRPGGQITWLKADGSPLLYQDALGKMSPVTSSLKLPPPGAEDGVTFAWTRCQVPPEAKLAKFGFKVDSPDIKAGQQVTVRTLAYYEHVRGEAYELDDLEPPALEVLTESPSSDFLSPIRFRITDKSGVDFAATKVWLDNRELALDSLAREGDAYVYRPTAPWKENTIHELKLDSRDTRGNFGVDHGFVAFTHTEMRHPKCTVRDDGMMLIDGKPFFPFGWCRMRPCVGNGFDMERGIRDMLANGMNAGHTYMAMRDGATVRELLKEQLALCQQHRLLLYFEPTERFVHRPRFVPLAEETMFGYRALEYPFLWGIGDDTSLGSKPEDIRRYYRLCKAVDPYVLTVSADVAGGAGMYEPYIPHVDITMVESYPIGPEVHEKEMAKVAADIDNVWCDTAAVGRKDRSVMVLPQCFKGWGWKRYPSIEEIKCQAYVAAACRARGIFYYASTALKRHMRAPQPDRELEYSGTGPLDQPELQAEFFAFSREFGELLPSLALRDAAEQPKLRILKGPKGNFLGAASIRCLLKEDGLLVAANTTLSEVTAEIQLPGGRCLTHTFPRYGYLVER